MMLSLGITDFGEKFTLPSRLYETNLTQIIFNRRRNIECPFVTKIVLIVVKNRSILNRQGKVMRKPEKTKNCLLR